MGLFNLFFGPKRALTEEEKRAEEALEKAKGVKIKELKERAVELEANIKAIAEENDFEKMEAAQFVKYAHILGKEDLVENIMPAHYTNKAMDFDGPGHVLFLEDRFVFVPDEWDKVHESFSFAYSHLSAMEKKRGIFSSHVRYACEEILVDGKEKIHPEGGRDGMIFYLKWEYKAFAQCLEDRLRQKEKEETPEGAAERAARKAEAAEKAMEAVRRAQAAAERARKEAEEARAFAMDKKAQKEEKKLLDHVDKY